MDEMAMLAIAVFAAFNILVVALVVRASNKPQEKRPEEEMAAFLGESLNHARMLRGAGLGEFGRPAGPGDPDGGEPQGPG